jgi:hypothetical protein
MEVLRLIKKYRQKQRLINKCQKELERCVHLVLFSYNKRSIQSNSARVLVIYDRIKKLRSINIWKR